MDTNQPQNSAGDQQSANTQSLLKDCLQVLVQNLMDIEVSQQLSASLYERSDSRRAYRNGYRQTVWNTPIGNIELHIPKLRRGTYYPDRLLNDGQISQRLVQLVRQCLITGVKSNHVSDMIADLHLLKLSAHELHRLCDALHLVIDSAQSRRTHIKENNRFVYQPSHDDSTKDEKKFWTDFSRRMAHAGFAVEDSQSVLSSVNPYAKIEVEVQEVIRPDFARRVDIQHIHSMSLIA